MGPAKDKHGVRQSFAKKTFLFAKNGRSRKKEFWSKPTYIMSFFLSFLSFFLFFLSFFAYLFIYLFLICSLMFFHFFLFISIHPSGGFGRSVHPSIHLSMYIGICVCMDRCVACICCACLLQHFGKTTWHKRDLHTLSPKQLAFDFISPIRLLSSSFQV